MRLPIQHVLVPLVALAVVPPVQGAELPREGCERLYTQAEHMAYSRAVYRRENVSRAAARRVGHMRLCQHTKAAKRLARRLTRRHRGRYARYRRVRPILERIAWCESHGRPWAISSSGTYRGKYQFDHGTWATVGGSGDPAAAPEWEQNWRATLLYERRGAAPWPVCGRG